jgi:porin
VKDHLKAVVEKLWSGQPLRGIGLLGRIGYEPEETNPITRDASVALFANGLSDHRPNELWIGNLSQWNQSTLKKR